MKKALIMASHYTGQTYKHNEAAKAMADLGVWIANMKLALPIKKET